MNAPHASRDPRRTLLAGLPVTERRIAVAGASTVVLEAGHGPTLILLHGGVEAGGAYWAPVIPALAQRYHLVVPDAPGLGESAPLAGRRLDQPRFDAWFAGLLAAIGDPRPALVAHSLLGTLAAGFAARHGDRLRALVIYGAPGVGPFRMPLGLAAVAILFDLWPSQRSQERFLHWVFVDPAVARAQHPEWFAAFDAYCVARGKVPHVKRTMRRLISAGIKRLPHSELARIRIPTTLLWGRHDRMVPLATAAAAAATLAWPLHVVEHAGHAPHLERPDAFLEALDHALPAVTAAGGVR